MLVLSGEDVKRLLAEELPITRILNNQAHVFAALSASAASDADAPIVECPARLSISAPCHTALFMPSRLDDTVACKIVSVPKPETGAPPGLPASVLLLDGKTGEVCAHINAKELTAVRTAAGSMLATQLFESRWSRGLEESSGSFSATFFGGGPQTAWHARQLAQLYPISRSETSISPKFAHAYFVLRHPLTPSSDATLAAVRKAEPGLEVSIVDASDREGVKKAVSSSCIVCAATPSKVALWESGWERPCAHVNLVGAYNPEMVEAPPGTLQASAAAGLILVDDPEACNKEAGDLLQAGLRNLPSLGSRLGSAKAQASSSRPDNDASAAVSVFKSVGVGAQDAAIAQLIYNLARERGVGLEVEL